jgi:hypothetical protein
MCKNFNNDNYGNPDMNKVKNINTTDSSEWSNYIKFEDLLHKINLEDMEYTFKSDFKIVLLDKQLNKKIAITSETVGNTEELIKLNPNLKILNEQGYKIGDYVELNFYHFSISQYKNILRLDNGKLTFYIDEVEVSIREASDMFIFLSDIKYGYYTNTDKYTTTISFKGVNENNYTDYYNQALFMVNTIITDESIIEIENIIGNNYNGSQNDIFWKDSLKYISNILIFKYCIQKKILKSNS